MAATALGFCDERVGTTPPDESFKEFARYNLDQVDQGRPLLAGQLVVAAIAPPKVMKNISIIEANLLKEGYVTSDVSTGEPNLLLLVYETLDHVSSELQEFGVSLEEAATAQKILGLTSHCAGLPVSNADAADGLVRKYVVVAPSNALVSPEICFVDVVTSLLGLYPVLPGKAPEEAVIGDNAANRRAYLEEIERCLVTGTNKDQVTQCVRTAIGV